jgi:hypothetical protein
MANYNPKRENLWALPRQDDSTGRLADLMLSVRVEVPIDALVRTVPNRAGWLRRVISEAALRELVAPAESPSRPTDSLAETA